MSHLEFKNRLNVGCGLCTPKGWLNTDSSMHLRLSKIPGLKPFLLMLKILPESYQSIQWDKSVVFLDITKKLPFRDGSFEAIYASHVLEHLFVEDVKRFLKEAHRILQPGGIIRIIVPDLDAALDQYIRSREEGENQVENNERLFRSLHIVPDNIKKMPLWIRWGRGLHDKNLHKWVYNEAYLKRLLGDALFKDIERKHYLDSKISNIKDIDQESRFKSALCVEAVKR